MQTEKPDVPGAWCEGRVGHTTANLRYLGLMPRAMRIKRFSISTRPSLQAHFPVLSPQILFNTKNVTLMTTLHPEIQGFQIVLFKNKTYNSLIKCKMLKQSLGEYYSSFLNRPQAS